MADKVKIYQIAQTVGITSTELLEICHRAGYAHITHHSNAVSAQEADEIRKTAIKLYKPKAPPAPKVPPAPKAAAKPPEAPPKPPEPARPVPKKPAPERKPIPSTVHVKPEPPPRPHGTRHLVEEAIPAVAEVLEEELPRERRRKLRHPPKEEVTKRTIIFKQPKRTIATKRVEKIEMTRPVTVRELSERMGIPAGEIIRELMFDHAVRASITQTLDDEVAQLIGMAHDVEVVLRDPRTAEDALLESIRQDAPEDLLPRPPVVALLGHVDHGKTSILDRIRNTRVAESEAGGITQDIGAWQVQTDGHMLTFIDTPGHEAFTAMRARGAHVTDIVVLVVAADDGVMPQTVEAINHARAAGVPIIVAINKMDKPQANPLRVRQQLAGHGLNPEEWGGNTGYVELSALTGQGVDTLLERVTLEAELIEAKANPNRPAAGAVMEARMQPGRGVVANVVVQKGTLRRGDIVVCGNAFGTVRSVLNDRGEEISEALPSQPVAFSGLDRVPEAGDTFVVVSDLEMARKVAEERARRLQRQRLQPLRRVTLENLFEKLSRGETKQLNVILKADVQGSLEPLLSSLSELGDQEVSVRVIHSAIGAVNQSDVLLADAADAIILAFRVSADEKVREMAAARGIQIVHYDVIYDVTQQIRAALEGLLAPAQREERLGLAEVRQIFRISRYGTIAGCRVAEGTMRRNARVRVIRDGQVLHQGAMASLRQEKNDVREVEAGRECGIHVEGFDDLKPADVIECFEVVSVRRTLAARPPRQAAEGQEAAPSSEQR